MRTLFSSTPRLTAVLAFAAALGVLGCNKSDSGGGGAPASSGAAAPAAPNTKKQSIQNIGSDTMVNLAQAWAEEYGKVVPAVSVEVSGGGSGVGIAALINGTADIANSSRHIEPEEAEKAKKATNKDPKEFLVGYDGLAIYVHKDNPMNEISMEDLGDIYREGGKVETWTQVGVAKIPGAQNDKIIRVSRQNNSGTYHYFREHVLKKKDFKLGTKDMHGSKDVVELIANTPCAIGYSGLGYATPAVKIVKVSAKQGQPAIQPSIETTLNKTYPIARPMFMYTPGSPPAHVQKYLDWILGDTGQKLVETSGYVPLPKK